MFVHMTEIEKELIDSDYIRYERIYENCIAITVFIILYLSTPLH
jgi:hypothetical protein